MTCKCPTCGSAVDRRLLVSLDTNTLVVDGQEIRLLPAEAEIAWVIAAAYPGTATTRDILMKVRPVNDESVNTLRLVRTQICQFRRRIAGSSISLVTETMRGYRFELAPMLQAAE